MCVSQNNKRSMVDKRFLTIWFITLIGVVWFNSTNPKDIVMHTNS